MRQRQPRAPAGRALWVLAAVLVAVGLVVAWRLSSGPEQRRDDPLPVDPAAEQRALALAAASREVQPDDPQLALLLAREALRTAAVRRTFDRLHAAWEALQPETAFAAHAGLVNAVRFVPDGRVLTAGRDHDAIVWHADGSAGVRLEGHRGPVLDVASSPSGDRFLTAANDGTARLFDASGRLVAVLSGHSGAVRTARFDARGERMLTIGLDGDARLWSDAATAGILDDGGAATLEAHFLGADVVLTRDDRGTVRFFGAPVEPVAGVAALRVVGGPEAAAALLLLRDGRVLRVDAATRGVTQLSRHAARVLDADADDDGDLVATASLDGTARLWSSDGAPRAVLAGHEIAVVAVAVDPAGHSVVTLGADGQARLWDGRGEPVATLEGPAFRDVGHAARGRVVWALPRDEPGLLLFDLHGRPIGRPHATGPALLALAFAPDDDRIAALTTDRRVCLILPTQAALLAASAQVIERDFTDAERARYLGQRIEAPLVAPAHASAATPVPAYAGTATCASCHRKEYDLWVASNHARTFEPAHAGNLPPVVRDGGTAAHPPGATTFGVDGGGYVASTCGDDGEVHAYPLGWVAGRRRIRMYVAEMPDGRLQVLPAMRARLTDEWFDYTHLLFGGDPDEVPVVNPGDDAFWTGAGRSWGARCARCHTSGAAPRLPTLARPGPRATWRDVGVDCEACHGPGREHAEAWARADTNAPLLRLGTLERKASIEACTTCHMEGEVVRSDYDLGEDLYEYLDPTLLIDAERVDPRGRLRELVYHGLSFGVSRCAQEGGLTCVRCHTAHGGTHPALLGRPPTNHELCSECHVDLVRDVAGHGHHDATGSGGSCVACHMPRLVIERGHGIITDHSIGVPDPTARGAGFTRDACSWCHQGGLGAPDGAVRLTDEQILSAYASWWPDAEPARPWMRAVAAGRTGARDAGAALVTVLEDRSQYRLVRATAARLLGRDAAAHADVLLRATHDPDSLVRRSAIRALATSRGDAVDKALHEALSDPSAAVRFAAARTALEGWARVQANPDLLAAILPVLAEEARAVPNDEMRWFRLGAAYDVAGDVARAVEAYGHMVVLHPLARHVKRRLDALREKLPPSGAR